MIPLKSFATQEEGSDDGEDSEGDNLLKHFELHKVHRTAVADITDTIGGHLKQYSKKAIPQERRITPIRGQWRVAPVACNFRWPYQANVINVLDTTNSKIVVNQAGITNIKLKGALKERDKKRCKNSKKG